MKKKNTNNEQFWVKSMQQDHDKPMFF